MSISGKYASWRDLQHGGCNVAARPMKQVACSSQHVGRCLKERLQKEDNGGHIILESIISIILSLRYKAGPQGALFNPNGGARVAIDGC